jgi:hypothetical protein
MGMSIDSGPNADLNLIAQGGEEFISRIKAYNESKAAMEEATARLGLGKDVAAQRDLLARDRNVWEEEKRVEREKHLAQIAQDKASFQDWVQQTREAELKARNAAEGKEAAADRRHAALDARERDVAAREAALEQRVAAIRAKAEDDHKARMSEIGTL